MTFIVTLLIWAAILTSVLASGSLILWWKGVDMIVLPGLGLIVGTPIIVLLFLLAEMGLVILAIFGKAAGANA